MLGVASFVPPRNVDPETVDQQLLVSNDGSLWVDWTDLCVCPWYATFAEAIVSESSCIFAP